MPKNSQVLRKLRLSWQKAVLHLVSLGEFSTDNQVKIFHEGDEAFSAIFQAIDQATHSIYIETYILAADRLGLKLQDELIKARNRGVEITIIYDHFGSAGISHSFFRPMIEVGIKVLAFNPIWPWRRQGPLLFRDHRKIIVVDRKLAFCGSMNISADYAGPVFGNDRFRDTVARIRGPATKSLLAITLESIAEAEFEKTPEALKKTIDFSLDQRSVIKQFFRTL